ncbi:MAG TPA: hypothetical protein DHW71_05445 [Gammaproteobacteria bacterium]|nr:hypothetical protein [Gammaproteobacteria bacterium]MBK83866.1 hypothetical protein [Gammaproteobacteria bacterium]MEC8011727.1 protein-disulfide reductase DsbD N-terminal domain-containing protein [Pseudomonadota bacterium]HBF09027.1 hypothetical protein [Gammaproteobacteria bacterium]HCK92406.1 hypothetical protein [Gammaproteobacteria bacterium]
MARKTKSSAYKLFMSICCCVAMGASHIAYGYFGESQAQAPVEFLKVEEAFKPTIELGQNQLKIIWMLEPGYYLYHKSFSFALLDGRHQVIQKLGQAEYSPAGIERHDEYMGHVMTYNDYLEIILAEDAQAIEKASFIEIKYQGCAEAGLCYPPSKRVFSLNSSEDSE